MKRELDEILTHALTPMEEPDFWLNQKILNRAKERKGMKNWKMNSGLLSGHLLKQAEGGKGKRRIPAMALTAAMLLGMGSLTAFAAWKYLAPERVAEEAGDMGLAKAFQSKDAVLIEESQKLGGYDVTLLGMVSGESLSEYQRAHEEEGVSGILSDRTYAVVAIANSDGTPLAEVQDEEGDLPDIFTSPLIGGYNPAFYNLASMRGNYTQMYLDGTLYRLVECDNVEIFADQDLYFCICDGSFYKRDAYLYDKETGIISRNEEYDGLNALFTLPVDIAKADPEKAAAYLEELGIVEKEISEEKLNAEIEDGFAVQAAEGNEKGLKVSTYALDFVGNPYVWGGDSLTEGTDCSGFTMKVYEQFGITLPHSSSGQKEIGSEIDGLDNALPGDLLFYENPAHVAMYVGDGKVVHAFPNHGICVSEADFDDIVMIRRIVEGE